MIQIYYAIPRLKSVIKKGTVSMTKNIKKIATHLNRIKLNLKYRKVRNLFKMFYADVWVNEYSFMVMVRCKKPFLSPSTFSQAKYCQGLGSDIESAFTTSHIIYAYLAKNGFIIDYPFYDSADNETIIFQLMKEDF